MNSALWKALCLLALLAVLSSCALSSPAPAPRGLPEGADVRLYLLVGQSNMAGRGQVSAVDREVHPRVFMLDADNRWQPAREPMHFDKPERIGVGPGLAFGKAMAQAHPGAIIGLIPSAVGGSQISSWKPGGYHAQTGVFPYDDAIARTRAALQTGGRLEAILWHQGEHDSRRDRAPRYAAALSGLAADLRRDIGVGDIPILVGGLGDFLLNRNTDAHTVQAALKSAPEKIANLVFVSAAGLADKGDELHFSAEAYRELGRRYAAMLVSITGRGDQRPRP